MNKLNNKTKIERVNIYQEMLIQERKAVLKELNFTDFKNLGLLNK